MRKSITTERRLEFPCSQVNRVLCFGSLRSSRPPKNWRRSVTNFALPPDLISRMVLESGTFRKGFSERVGALYQHDYSLSVSVSRKVWPCGIYTFRCGSELVTFSGYSGTSCGPLGLCKIPPPRVPTTNLQVAERSRLGSRPIHILSAS